jgi:hypothetical protein
VDHSRTAGEVPTGGSRRRFGDGAAHLPSAREEHDVAIKARQVSKVIIGGEWFSVELGTFEVVEMEFTDDVGQPTHGPLETKAYTFLTPNRDRYYGPLSAIDLIKLAEI